MSGKIMLAESAGFCYGVQRAVDLAEKTAAEQGSCWMLGDLIHNTHVVEDLTARGVTGPAVGQVLHRLLDHVIDCPADNDRGVLLKFLEEELEHD